MYKLEFSKFFKKKDLSFDIYEKKLKGRYLEISILGMGKPINLMNLYVNAYLIKEIRKRINSTHDEINLELDSFTKKEIEYKKFRNLRIDALDTITLKSNFILLGKPGSGKTTFLKYLTIYLLIERLYKNDKLILPIFITLKEVEDAKKSLIQSINNELLALSSNVEIDFYKHIEKYYFLILLDGLDEISDNSVLNNTIKEIVDLKSEFKDDIKLIVSSRTASYHSWFPDFEDLEVADFNLSQILKFSRNFFESREKINDVEEFLNILESEPSYMELATSPLFLTFLCLYFEKNNKLTSNKGELYSESIDIIFSDWDIYSKRLNRKKQYNNFTKEIELQFLTKLAYEQFSVNKSFFKKTDLITFFENFRKDYSSLDNLELGKLLIDMETRHGLIIERQKDLYSFCHLTFQEYFCANYILRFKPTNEVLLYTLLEDRWNVICVLIASMANKAEFHDFLDLVILSCKNKIKKQNNFLDIPTYKEFININKFLSLNKAVCKEFNYISLHLFNKDNKISLNFFFDLLENNSKNFIDNCLLKLGNIIEKRDTFFDFIFGIYILSELRRGKSRIYYNLLDNIFYLGKFDEERLTEYKLKLHIGDFENDNEFDFDNEISLILHLHEYPLLIIYNLVQDLSYNLYNYINYIFKILDLCINNKFGIEVLINNIQRIPILNLLNPNLVTTEKIFQILHYKK